NVFSNQIYLGKRPLKVYLNFDLSWKWGWQTFYLNTSLLKISLNWNKLLRKRLLPITIRTCFLWTRKSPFTVNSIRFLETEPYSVFKTCYSQFLSTITNKNVLRTTEITNIPQVNLSTIKCC